MSEWKSSRENHSDPWVTIHVHYAMWLYFNKLPNRVYIQDMTHVEDLPKGLPLSWVLA